MKVRMNMQVIVEAGDADDVDDAVALATDKLQRGFKKSGIEIVWIGREAASAEFDADNKGEKK